MLFLFPLEEEGGGSIGVLFFTVPESLLVVAKALDFVAELLLRDL